MTNELGKREGVYSQAIKCFGKEHQLVLALQELSELSKAITKYLLRNDIGETHELCNKLYNELADVDIMVEQIIFMFDAYKDVGKVKKEKVQRLKKRIKNEKKNNR